MKLFGKKRPVIFNLVDELKKNPNECWVGPEFMAVWSPVLNKAIFIPGDYTKLSDEEVNQVLIEKSLIVLQ